MLKQNIVIRKKRLKQLLIEKIDSTHTYNVTPPTPSQTCDTHVDRLNTILEVASFAPKKKFTLIQCNISNTLKKFLKEDF